MKRGIFLLALILSVAFPAAAERISNRMEFLPGPVNGLRINVNGKVLVVYGDPSDRPAPADSVLFTHHRRDVVETGRKLVENGAKAIVPQEERHYFESPSRQWDAFMQIRLSDTAQQSTKMLTRPIPVHRGVRENDVVDFHGVRLRILDTPGFTRAAVSYVTDLDGHRVAFTGDLIHSDGRILDLYSFQDRIPEAKIGGYHGYGARLAQLLDSLTKIEQIRPTLLVPARGPILRSPVEAIRRLRERVKRLYRNYLSTNALYWYFKEDRLRACAERILGPDAQFDLMPYSRHEEAPEWILNTGTTRILLAESGAAFLLDCGSERYIRFVEDLMKQGLIKRVEGIFVTHYHGDHTHFVQRAAETFDCPVYATEEYEDILENPGAWHMAAGTPNAIREVIGFQDNTTVRWHEYELTFRFFPGQTLLHGALLAKRPESRPVFFIGDAFTPSGLDDYCVQNRNLLHEDTGYLKCLKMVRDYDRQPGGVWLMNQHVTFVFDYTGEQMDYLEQRYRERIAILEELFPWNDPNYGVDEQWAWFYPYATSTRPGGEITFEFRFYNHSPTTQTMRVNPKLPAGFSLAGGELSTRVEARQQAVVPLTIRLEPDVPVGNHILTADVITDEVELREWSEAIVTVVDQRP